MAKKREDPRYPLQWPIGWQRTPSGERTRSGFSERATVSERFYNSSTLREDVRQKKGTKTVSLRTACDRLQDQLERLGAEDIVLSTNVELTLGGEPRGDRRAPDDPGAAAYFTLDGKERVMACDKWLTVQENIASIANHIDALRRIERYGIGTREQAFTGYNALPSPSVHNRPAWRRTLGFKDFTEVTRDDVNVNYKALARGAATDEKRLLELNLAREAALQELGAN